MPELTLDALLSFMRASIEGVRADLGGQIAALAEQTRVEHGKVQESIQDLGSEMRQVTSMASAAKILSEANATGLAAHEGWHQRSQDRHDGAVEAQKRWIDTAWDISKDVIKAAALIGLGAAVAVLKGHL